MTDPNEFSREAWDARMGDEGNDFFNIRCAPKHLRYPLVGDLDNSNYRRAPISTSAYAFFANLSTPFMCNSIASASGKMWMILNSEPSSLRYARWATVPGLFAFACSATCR